MFRLFFTQIRERFHRNPYLYWAPILFTSAYYLLGQAQSFNSLENLTVDSRFRARAGQDAPASNHLMLVAIDEDSLKTAGAWPWSRALHGDFLKLMQAGGASVVAFDFAFTEPQSDSADAALAGGMAAMGGNVITGAITNSTSSSPAEPGVPQAGRSRPITHIEGDPSHIFRSPSAELPIERLRAESYFGFVDSPGSGPDGIRRRVPLLVRVGSEYWPSLSTQALLSYWHLTADQLTVKLGRYLEFPTAQGMKRVPINAAGELNLNYRNKDSFVTWGYIRLSHFLALTYVKGKPWPPGYPSPQGRIVVVGQQAPGLSDLGPSPLDAVSPLVLVHLTVLDNILREDYLRIVPDRYVFVGWVLLTYLCLIWVRSGSALTALAMLMGVIVGYTALTFSLFWWRSIQLPLIWPTLAFATTLMGYIFHQWATELAAKQRIQSVFSAYISPGIMQKLLRDPDSIRLGGARKPVTIFFSDIRGFTTISEGADEEELVRQLNEYFERMVECVTRYDGTLHKYIGDAIMAVWGDVLLRSENDDAKNAVRAALAMRRELVTLNEFWRQDGRIELSIGMGLNFGTVCVGNIGATQRREYTVIGDAVNLASRLEGLTKSFKTDLCIGQSVHALLDNEFLTRSVGLVVLKGSSRPMRVYEVLDDLTGKEATHFQQHEWARRYEEAYEAYLARDFEFSSEVFKACLKEVPGDYLSTVYYQFSSDFSRYPPDEHWRGVIVMQEK